MPPHWKAVRRPVYASLAGVSLSGSSTEARGRRVLTRLPFPPLLEQTEEHFFVRPLPLPGDAAPELSAKRQEAWR